jgi:hypothetical protein
MATLKHLHKTETDKAGRRFARDISIVKLDMAS